MTAGPARALRPGHRIAIGQAIYTVVQLNGTAVTLQDEHGELSAFLLGYLLTAPGFEALDAGAPKRAPQDGRISALGEAEQERIRWLEGHLIELETGRHPDGPLKAVYDLDLHNEAKAVAVDANRPVRPRADEPDDGPATDSGDEPDDRAEPDLAVNPGGYDVFDPGDVPWRL